jgi:hypothetical protein
LQLKAHNSAISMLALFPVSANRWVACDCIKRDRLIRDWHEAVLKFSDSLGRLRKCRASKFADQHKATEVARLNCENARMMLDLHRAEHGC